MTLWLIKIQPESFPENVKSGDEGAVVLPIPMQEDFTNLKGAWEIASKLKEMHPDWPPEKYARESERMHADIYQLSIDDTLVFSCPDKEEVMFGEANTEIYYSEGGYRIDVRWFPPAVAFKRFGRFKKVFTEQGKWLRQVNEKGERMAIYDRMPVKSNRFAKWKWIFLILFGGKMLYMSLQRIFSGF